MRTKRYKLLIFLLLLVSLTACGKSAREENQTLLEKATIRDPEAAEASIMSEDESAPEKNGFVIGVITATYDDGQNLNVATPISEAESIQ